MRVPASCSALVPTLAFAQIFRVFNTRDSSAGSLSNDVTRDPYVWLALLRWSAMLVGAA